MTIRDIVMVTEANLEEVRGLLQPVASAQAETLVVGCQSWTFENLEGFRGRITLWPDGRQAALASEAKNHWGQWDAERRILRLDNGDIYDAEGAVGEDA